MNLIEAIQHIGKLDYDTLRDVRDLLEFEAYNDQIRDSSNRDDRKRLTHYRNLIKLRIRGRDSYPDGRGKRWDDIRYPDELQPLPK